MNGKELAKQEIHGSVEVGICPDEEDQSGVSCDSSGVDKEGSRDKEVCLLPGKRPGRMKSVLNVSFPFSVQSPFKIHLKDSGSFQNTWI